MTAQDVSGKQNESGAVLIAATAALLAKRRSDIPPDFVAALFGLAVPEDLNRYGVSELAAIAERSWAFLAERRIGSPKVRFEPAAEIRGISVLEVLNDDMPFLYDSVVGEINERGLNIRLLVHPVFSVSRDAGGALVAFDASAKADGRHESFIHIHIDGVEDAARRADTRSRSRRHPR